MTKLKELRQQVVKAKGNDATFYKACKSFANLYERLWRTNNPRKHNAESKKFVTAIKNPKKVKKNAKHK